MEKRVEIFRDASPYDLESKVNDFLAEQEGKLHEVLFDAFFDTFADSAEYVALLVYTPQEGEDGEENKNTEENEKGNAGVQRARAALREQGGSCSKVALASCSDWAG